MSIGRIDTTFDEATMQEVLGLIAQLRTKLPFLLRLTTDEKSRLPKPHPGARQVIETVGALSADMGLSQAQADPMAADLSVFIGLTAISHPLAELVTLVEDTRLQAGSEAWSEALIRYGMLRQRERSSPEIKDQLDQIRPLITSRSTRSVGASQDAPEGDE